MVFLRGGCDGLSLVAPYDDPIYRQERGGPPAHLSPNPPLPEPGPAAAGEEHGGPKGEEPTRFGDWENKGICWDF